MKINFKKLLISILLPLSCGAIAGIATSSNIDSWYKTLIQPSFAPPNWLFGPAWTTLYILMGIALYLVWTNPTTSHWKQKAFFIFGIQLVLNFLWSFLFFHFHWKGIALFEICLLWISIFLTILVFAKVNKTAAWLLVPYIAWVTFATILNYYFWSLNTPV
jgi:translocator protein